MYRYLQCFFTLGCFSIAGNLPKWPKIPLTFYQHDPKWSKIPFLCVLKFRHLCVLKFRHPKIVQKLRKHHQDLDLVPSCGLGAKPFLAPLSAKADIGTAISTNVIEHLVLLFPLNKHAFTAKAAWADLKSSGPNHTLLMLRWYISS